MSSISENSALQLIKAALEAQSIKLLGCTVTGIADAQIRAKADAAYLVTLFSQLTASTQQP